MDIIHLVDIYIHVVGRHIHVVDVFMYSVTEMLVNAMFDQNNEQKAYLPKTMTSC